MSALALAALSLLLVSCGGATKKPGQGSSQSGISIAGLPRAPEGIVVRVGPIAITQATYERWFAGNVATEVPAFRVAPIPPHFTACIDHIRHAIEGLQKHVPAPSRAELKSKCADQYQESQQRVLNQLITNEWVVGAAKELGVKLSNAVVERSLDEDKRKQYPSEASYRAFLQEAHQTEGDLLFQKRIALLSEAIRARLKARVGAFTPSRVAAYYRAHLGLYAEPETRDLHIVRTETLREALKARREIASGKSFAKVVASVHVPQAIYSKNGFVRGLKPHAYTQPPLNDAIFSAKPGELSRPIHITLGYYVFELTKVHAAHEKPLSEVRAKIEHDVPASMQRHALAAFIAQWRKHWTAQTVCAPGFVVRRCREYKVTSTTPHDDEYTLD
jgi:foldase protein PrsA